jgi:hypothetical protein
MYNSIALRPSSNANSFLDGIQSQMNPVHILIPMSLRWILILSFNLRLRTCYILILKFISPIPSQAKTQQSISVIAAPEDTSGNNQLLSKNLPTPEIFSSL